MNYDLHEAVEQPGTFFFYENWESAEHLEAHLATPHLVRFAEIMGDLLDDDSLTINSATEPVEMVVARSTQEAIVVPVHDHPHAPSHAR